MMIQYFNLPGLRGVGDNGDGSYRLDFDDGPRAATADEILAATKAHRIEADRKECRRRLTEHFGDALEQVSRASGLYGATAQSNHAAGVEACIAASNVARDLINAATTLQEVEAVIVAWPVLT